MVNRILREPVLIIGAIESVLLAAVAFGLNWDGEQIAAFMIAVTAILSFVARAFSTPVHDPRGIDGF